MVTSVIAPSDYDLRLTRCVVGAEGRSDLRTHGYQKVLLRFDFPVDCPFDEYDPRNRGAQILHIDYVIDPMSERSAGPARDQTGRLLSLFCLPLEPLE